MSKILVVEDDQHIRRIISMWLERNGHEVLTAEDGVLALELIRTEAPDLLVTDVNMPKMSGIELLETVRREGLLDRPAIILTSRCDQREIEVRLSKLRASIHPKPFSPLRLVEAIEKALADDGGQDNQASSLSGAETSNG